MWRFLRLVQSSRYGQSAKQLAEALGVDKSTIYRDKKNFESAGIFFEIRERDDAVYWCLPDSALPRLSLSDEQQWALMLMQPLLEPLEGSALHRSLLPLWGKAQSPKIQIQTPKISHDEAVVSVLDDGLAQRRRVLLTYANEKRKVEIVEMVLREGALYAQCVDVVKAAPRTFKVSRVQGARLLLEKCDFDDSAIDEFENSVGVWGGQDVDVAVRVLPEVADFVREWPLCDDQEVTLLDDGSALVKARVAGLREAMRWVLRWGRNAVVESPEALRELVVGELEGALFLYGRSHAVENGGG